MPPAPLRWRITVVVLAALCWWLLIQRGDSHEETRRLADDLYRICQAPMPVRDGELHDAVESACDTFGNNADALNGAEDRSDRTDGQKR